MRTFWFESKKIAKRRTTWIAIILSITAVVGLYFFNYSVAENIHEGNITKLKNDVLRTEDYISSFLKEKQVAEEADDFETAKEIEITIDGYENSKALKQEKVKASEEENWAITLEEEINDLTFLFEVGEGSLEPPMSIEDQHTSWFTFRATLEEKQLLLNNKIVPFIQNATDIAFLPTIYDDFTGKSLEQWETMTNRYGTTGFSFLYQLVQLLYIPIIVLIGCFLFGNGISSESGKKKRGLHFFAVLPFRKGNVFISKYASGLMYTLGFSLIMLIIPVLCSLFTSGIGSLDYPVLVYHVPEPNPYGDGFTTALNSLEDSFHFMKLKEYLGYVLLFTVVCVFFLYSIYFTISLFVRNPGIAIVLLGSLVFIGMNVYQNAYNPFTYIDIHQIITEAKATIDSASTVTYKTGLLLLTSIGALVTGIGYMRFRYSKRLK